MTKQSTLNPVGLIWIVPKTLAYVLLVVEKNYPRAENFIKIQTHRGGFKAESLIGHITRKASSPLPSILLPLPSPLLPSSLPSPPSEVLPPQIQLGGLGSVVSSPSGVWGRAPAEIEFGAF